MDQIFRSLQMDESLKVSITDSTMMKIVHKSMDRAHKRVKSKNEALERLSEISKFYLLAVIELEGCLKFLQDQTGNYLLESSREEEVLAELTEMRDHLKFRLEETDMAFSEKDEELRKRSVNELKLRQTLEMKERELVSLRAKFEHGNHESDDMEKEGEFSELKLSVDQQVLNIKQQLEPDSESTHDRKIDTMGSDINFLKETLDLAFGKMHDAIFLFELGPKEHEWMWDIERGTTTIVIRDFLKCFQESFDQQVMEQKAEFSDELSKNLLDVMQEVNGLHDEIKLLSHDDEIPMKNLVPLPPLTNPKDNDTLKGKGNSLSEGDDFESNSPEEDPEKSGQNYVAKMVKNHESIIRRKSEELNHMQREILQERACAAFMRRAESVGLRKKLHKIARALETLINSSNMFSTSSNSNNYNVTEMFHEKKFTTLEIASKEAPGLESFEEVWAKVNKSSGSKEGRNATFIKPESRSKKKSFESIKMAVQNDIFRVLLNESVVQWNMEVDSCKIKHIVAEEMQGFIFSKVLEESLRVNKEARAVNIDGTTYPPSCSNNTKEHEDHNERKKLTQTLDKLFKSLEKDEALMLSACAETKEFVLDESETFSERYGEKKNVCSSVCCKLEEALWQLGLGKALVSELHLGLGLVVSDSKTDDPEGHVELSESVLTAVQGFLKGLKDFEQMTNRRLWMNTERLGEIMERLDQIINMVASLSKREALYRNAFYRRCENLQKAENEVDALADKVEFLLAFLEKLYKTLHQHSHLLQHYFEVSNILKLIQEETGRMKCQLDVEGQRI